MRRLKESRHQLLASIAQFDDAAHSEVLQFLEKYPSETSYKIYFVDIEENRTLYEPAPLHYNELPFIVATDFVYATSQLKWIPNTPQPDRVELEYNFGKHVVYYDVLKFRIYYKVDGQLLGFEL
jgi:hypothetical protein